jgi:site-specific DNA-methyltransferase (adenine-specific)
MLTPSGKGLERGEMKKYNIIYADPPWKYNDKMVMQGVHGAIRGAEYFYNTMTLQDIKNLPIKEIADNNCILFIWVTMPLLPSVFEVIKAWGFEYKTCGFTWIKKTKKGKNHLGMGHYTRGNAELCLIAKKGKIKILNHSISQIIESEIQQHSKKPDVIRDKIVELLGDLPRVELFARQKAEGWDVWGNEVECDLEL